MSVRCAQCNHENAPHARFCSACGSMLALPMPGDPLLGTVIAERFRVLQVLGEGGMGRVYLAEQRMGTTTRPVAIKVLAASLSDQSSITRFYRECETVVQLTHPNTIRFYDFGALPDGRLYIAMEYVDGRSLSKLIADGPVPLAEVERIVASVGGALSEAHRRGIVHRDLKPDNILLAKNDDEGEIPKVLDFGIAKHTRPDVPEVTAAGTVVGTPAYMSPEQLTGFPVDERSDVYALALITFEMLTGQRAYLASSAPEWATAHLTRQPRSFDEFPSTQDLPQPKRDAILRALAKDPPQRTPSVRRFVEELTGVTRAGSSGPRAATGSSPGDAISPVGATMPAAATPPAISRTARPTGSSALLPTLFGLGAAGAFVGLLATGLYVMQMQSRTTTELDAGPPPIDAGPPETDSGPPLPTHWISILNGDDRAVDAGYVLGPPDGRCALLRPGGKLVLELTPGVRMTSDGAATPDLYIVVDPERSGPYRVDVGQDRHRESGFVNVASDIVGSSPIDIDQFDVRQHRYVRIKNRQRQGDVCIDAVGAFHADR